MLKRKVSGRRLTLRRVIFFQFKLLADAARDFIMSPLSIGCFILDFILGSKQGEGYFDRLMHVGRRSDRLINLFEQHEDERISSEEKVAEQ